MGSPHASVDCVVVGAGVIGLSTAWELHRHGLRVAVVDPDPGGGASRAAAGMIAPASEVVYQQHALYPLMTASAAEYPAFVGDIEAAAEVDVAYRSTDTLVCAATPADRQALADLRAYQRQQRMDVEQLTTRAARALEPALSPRLAAAFRAAGDHQVDPRRLVAGLLAALESGERRNDSTVVRQRAVALLRGADGHVQGVRLADGSRIMAAETVVANGLGGPEELLGSLRLPLRPVHGDILRMRAPAGTPPLIERTIRGLVHGFAVYLVPRADGEIVVGATTREDGMAGVSAGGVFRLLRDAQALVPGSQDLVLEEVMARARPATPDDLPFLGRGRSENGEEIPGLIVSTGYFRHGVLLAPLAARLTAELVIGSRTAGGPVEGALETGDRLAGTPVVEAPVTGGPAAGRPPDSDPDATALAAIDPHRFAAPR
ncbi:glycine oxidase ThiO [Brevibacterium yomogidense]|uniref:glycine oxidase ThiO n=1 Tax=Brevibacterium yomogidense TaxID=946573 RepID=UPI0018E01826|nr:glycine oxidase ThiO [Brevibacterium yomogidense]